MLLPVPPFMPGEYSIKHVAADWERKACAALRRQVFCTEQRLFDADDRDTIDDHALPIAAIARVAGIGERVVGTVRIHRPEANDDSGLWFGSRLAVLPEYRHSAWIGTELIHHAVRTARARGCRRFLAQVQVQNVKLFEHLDWVGLASRQICGRPHVLMQASLDHYPPRTFDEVVFAVQARVAA